MSYKPGDLVKLLVMLRRKHGKRIVRWPAGMCLTVMPRNLRPRREPRSNSVKPRLRPSMSTLNLGVADGERVKGVQRIFVLERVAECYVELVQRAAKN